MKTRTRVWLVLPFLGCGCVGYVTALPRERLVEALAIADGLTTDSLTPEELASHWGEPGERRSEDGDEIWVYERERQGAGIVLFPVVPLPLLLPVTHRRVEFRFRDRMLLETRERTVRQRMALCALAMGPCSAPGCYRDR